MDESCMNCKFFWSDQEKADQKKSIRIDGGPSTFCRRFPPTVFHFTLKNEILRQEQTAVATSLVPVKTTNWCGEWIYRE